MRWQHKSEYIYIHIYLCINTYSFAYIYIICNVYLYNHVERKFVDSVSLRFHRCTVSFFHKRVYIYSLLTDIRPLPILRLRRQGPGGDRATG